MKKFSGIAMFLVLLPFFCMAEEIAFYRTFITPRVNKTEANDFCVHINNSLYGFFGETTREKATIDIITNEIAMTEFLENEGLIELDADLEDNERAAKTARYVLFVDKLAGRNSYVIVIYTIKTMTQSRVPSLSASLETAAKKTSRLFCEFIEDPQRKKKAQRQVNRYYSRLFNNRTIDLAYSPLVFLPGTVSMLPVGGSVGLTLPGRNSSLAFSANISVLYMTREEYLFSGSAGLAVLKRDSRFSPLFALRAGCAAEIEQKKSLFGPSLESTLSFGLFLAPSLKVSIEGVTRAAYFPENKTFTVTGGAGFGLGIAF